VCGSGYPSLLGIGSEERAAVPLWIRHTDSLIVKITDSSSPNYDSPHVRSSAGTLNRNILCRR